MVSAIQPSTHLCSLGHKDYTWLVMTMENSRSPTVPTSQKWQRKPCSLSHAVNTYTACYTYCLLSICSIATVSGYNTWYSDRIRWSDWRRYNEDQRSETLDLYTNSSYLLVGLVKEGVAADFLRVSLLCLF